MNKDKILKIVEEITASVKKVSDNKEFTLEEILKAAKKNAKYERR